MDDEKVASDFFDTLRPLGFRIPPVWKLGQEIGECYVISRRNRSAADRYLLTQPGSLACSRRSGMYNSPGPGRGIRWLCHVSTARPSRLRNAGRTGA